MRGIEKTFAWIGEHGGIPLTPSMSFKRVFAHRAAAEFDWPGHTNADFFAANKVLNKRDFAPLRVLHDLMIAMKLGRRLQPMPRGRSMSMKEKRVSRGNWFCNHLT